MSARTLVGLALLLASVAAGQDDVLRTKAELVRLDVVVVDAEGRPVRDLTAADFQLLEDGKPQRIENFVIPGPTLAAVEEAEEGASAGGAATAPAPAGTALSRGRYIVVFVDDVHIQADNLVVTRQALHRFAKEFVAPADSVVLATSSAPGTAQQFTRDRASLDQAIDQLVGRDTSALPARGSGMTAAQAELVLKGDSSALKLAARTLMDTPGTGYSPGDVQRQGSGRLIIGGLDREEAPAAEEAERQARAILGEALRFSTVTLDRLSDVVRGLAAQPGRKICLLVSDGFLVGAGTSEERTRDMQAVIDAATRAGAVVYALDSRGLVTTAGDASADGSRQQPQLQFGVERRAQQLYLGALMSLANDTGGFVVRGTNDLASGLRRMLEDTQSYYLMSYAPTNTKHDGRFRKIELRVLRGTGYLVRTRKGYFAPDDRKPAAARPAPELRPASRALDEAEVRAMLGASRAGGDLPVRLAADYLELPPGGPQAVVQAYVDLGALRWQDGPGRKHAGLDVWGGVFDARGAAVGAPFGRHADLDLSVDEQRRAVRDGFTYQKQVPLPPGRYEIRWVAAEPDTERLGASSQWLDVPDLGRKTLAMSGIFLSSGAAAGEGTAALRMADARRRFSRADSLYFQVYVYNPSIDAKGASDVVLQAQLWAGGKVIAASKPRPAALQSKDGAPVPETNGMPLGEMAPGDYDLRVVVVDRKAGASVTRSAAIVLE